MSDLESKDQSLFDKLADEPVTKDKLLKYDEILTEDDKKKPDVNCKPAGESSKPKKACANCTCGLAEELEKDARDKTAENVTAGKSSCGSCYLGDAFRCASCPYRGMPAFKPGEKVTVDLGTDDL